jgi:uncharacterized SAM-binding protein YcdF (DUF218 family)
MRRLRPLLLPALALLVLGLLLSSVYQNRADLLERFLSRGEFIPQDYAEMIFVPGSGCNPGVGTQERLDLAARFYAAKRRKIVVSEKFCPDSEQERFRRYMRDNYEINEADFIWIAEGANSTENAQVCLKAMRQYGASEVILCTSSFHQARMKVLLRKAGVEDFKVATMEEKLKRYKYLEPYRSRMMGMMLREVSALALEWLR